MTDAPPPSSPDAPPLPSWPIAALQCGLAWLVCYVVAGEPVPGINEAHYLVKAKNFWDPAWLDGDIFADSGKAQYLFYATFGALTQVVSLPASAWIGRIVGWLLLAAGVTRLSNRLLPAAPITAPALIMLVWYAGIEACDLAGEWVIGGIEAKVPAYGFVLFALSAAAANRWRAAWVLFGVASAFHVLVGGWSVVAALFASLLTGERRAALLGELPALIAGGLISLIGLVPPLLMNASVPQETLTEAARLYSYHRLAHHILPAHFPLSSYVEHALLLGLWFFLIWPLRRTPGYSTLWRFSLGVLATTICGLVVGILPAVAPDLAARLLRFYWFRLEDSIIPLSLGFAVAGLLYARQSSQLRRIAAFATLLWAAGWTSVRYWRSVQVDVPPACEQTLLAIHPFVASAQAASPDRQERIFQQWRATCAWIRDNTPPDAVFLTPRHQQTFKWYAHRTEVVNWKDVPQDAAAIVEWWQRMDNVFPGPLGRAHSPTDLVALRQLADQYGADFLVVDTRVQPQPLPLPRVYPSPDQPASMFNVYKLMRQPPPAIGPP